MTEARKALTRSLRDGKGRTERLRALWSLAQTGGIPSEATRLAGDDEVLKGWTLQLAAERAATLDWNSGPGRELLSTLKSLAAKDPSPVVRRQIASALQRIPVEHRWDTLTALLQHAEDAADHNLPQLYWMAAEGGAATNPDRALTLLKACKIPKVREFIARRLATASLARN
jgi:hypothetical protein